MNAKELMIGDWVEWKHQTDKRYHGKYRVAVVEEKWIDFYDEEEQCCSQPYKEIFPIPLTEEILEKNGFKKQDDGCYIITLEEENLIGVQPFENVNWIFGANVFPNIIEHLNILYVHELQHALRLCGVEKEITI